MGTLLHSTWIDSSARKTLSNSMPGARSQTQPMTSMPEAILQRGRFLIKQMDFQDIVQQAGLAPSCWDPEHWPFRGNRTRPGPSGLGPEWWLPWHNLCFVPEAAAEAQPPSCSESWAAWLSSISRQGLMEACGQPGHVRLGPELLGTLATMHMCSGLTSEQDNKLSHGPINSLQSRTKQGAPSNRKVHISPTVFPRRAYLLLLDIQFWSLTKPQGNPIPKSTYKWGLRLKAFLL